MRAHRVTMRAWHSSSFVRSRTIAKDVTQVVFLQGLAIDGSALSIHLDRRAGGHQ